MGPLPPQLADAFAFPRAVAGSTALFFGRWGPQGVPALAKAWRPAGGPSLATRMAWQARAHAALGTGCPRVLHHRAHDGQCWTVTQVEPGRPVPTPLDPGLLPAALTLLDRLHQAGLAHRDIKAGNLHLCGNGRLLLLDLEEVWDLSTPHQGPPLGTADAQDPSTDQPGASADRYALGALVAPGPLRRALRAPQALRAQALEELRPELAPVLTAGSVAPVTGWQALHDIPGRAAKLLARKGAAAALAFLRRQGIGTPTAGMLWMECAELELLAAHLAPRRLAPGQQRQLLDSGQAGLLVAHALLHSDAEQLAVAAAAVHRPAVLRRASWHLMPTSPAGRMVRARLLAPTDPAAALALVPEADNDGRAALLVSTAPDAALALLSAGPSLLRAQAELACGRPRAALAALPSTGPAIARARHRTLAAACHHRLGQPVAARDAAVTALRLVPAGADPALRCRAALYERQARAQMSAPPPPSPDLLHNLLHHLPPAAGQQAVDTECRLARLAGAHDLADQLATLRPEHP